ncbi:Na(+)/H(+) antiporter subunit D [Oceanidesulfovibrio indonesiensis]|uniref:Na(+)/H(+) antiporter subunit D n=1 Tax=Oceanidesulfovibrio indonesiensis TaxID=54767 RepID=A0A7M3MGL3_9BACT|nr:Na(+)/H(+) antiporter subunit D [Oceanidesulfovibrio indonesiensis]TVM18463.1 Na(+)/H(+) antiporter subunit D [Oceanidesulfovibrio indonesiensis]
MIETHPALFLILGALLIPLLKEGRTKDVYLVLLPLVSLYNMLMMPHGSYYQWEFLGFTIEPLRIDGLSIGFATIFHIVASLGMCFALSIKSNIERTFAMLYAGAAVGTVFAGDLLSMFLFWESLTVTATVIIWCRRTSGSQGAGFRYLIFHALGGLILLAGIVLHIHNTGSVAFEYIGLDSTASWLIMLGFGINAAWPGLHAWLTDAYPEASYAGAVFLSAFTTKSAVYVLARGFPGTDLLAIIGTVMAVYGVFYATIENNARRILSYHIVSQVGYMVAGIGIGTAMTVNGSCAHAIAHILYKGLLFMGTGCLLYAAGTTKLTELGGLVRRLPLVFIFYMVGALSISGMPFFNGFVSKTMTIAGAANEHYTLVALGLEIAAVGTFLSVGLKLPYFAFYAKPENTTMPLRKIPTHMYVAMAMGSFLCILTGLWPELLYSFLPFQPGLEPYSRFVQMTEYVYTPYTLWHILQAFMILGFTGLGFYFMRKVVVPHAQRNLDFDYLYRLIGRSVLWVLDKVFNGLNRLCNDLIVNRATDAVIRACTDTPYKLARMAMTPYWSMLDADIREKKERAFSRSFETYSSPVGITGMLAAALVTFLIIYMFIN